MRIASSCLVASLTLLTAAFAVHAQQDASNPAPTRMTGQLDPTTGKPSMAPAGMKPPADGWIDAEKTPDAVKKGTAAVDAMQKAYAQAKTLTDRAEITIRMPDGEQNEVIDMAFGEGNAMIIKTSNLQLISVDNAIYVVPDEPANRYLIKKTEGAGNANEALVALLPGFALPAPDLALRFPLANGKALDAFSMGGMKDIAVKGFRQVGDTQELLLSGLNSEAVVSIDAKTNFARSVSMLFTPDGLPESVKVGFVVKLNPSSEPLKAPIAFNGGTRTAVAKIEDLFAPADNEPPVTVSVKEGAVAPLAVLATIDGKPFDLASLKGKVIVIDFWATWCGPCRKGLPLLQKFADEMKSNDKVAVFAVNVWEQDKGEALTKKVQEFWSKQNFTMGLLLDTDAKFISQYGFTGIPACIVIGPDGKLITSHIGFRQDMVENLRADVTKALDPKALDPKASGINK